MSRCEELRSRLRLVAITDRRLQSRALDQIVAELLAGGVTAVVLREKDLSPRELFVLADSLREMCRKAGALLIVSQSVEVALAVGADGVHLGRQSLPLDKARALARAPFLIGFSAHDESEVHCAVRGGADYVFLSPVHPPRSKSSPLPPLGFEGLGRLARTCPLPPVALGGLLPDDAASCLEAGAVGVAAIGGLFGAPDPRIAARNFAEAM